MAKEYVIREKVIVSGKSTENETGYRTLDRAKKRIATMIKSQIEEAHTKGIGIKLDIAPTWVYAEVHPEGGDIIKLGIFEQEEKQGEEDKTP